MTKNDEAIMTLRKQIDDKKKSLKSSERFSPVTNCSIELDGLRYNIQVLTKEQIIAMMVKLNSYRMSAKDLGLLDEYQISGFAVAQWLADLMTRLDIVNRKTEENKLKMLEERLHKLLSDDKKTELEIDEISKLLN
jgi:hypothetical protein